MNRKLTMLVSTLALSVLMAQPASAERAIAVSVPINPVFYSACALGGAGEFIDASGEVHVVIKGDAIPTPDGSLVLGETGLFIFGWNLTGYGRTSGNEYRLIDNAQELAQATFNGDAAGVFFNIRANFIDPGSDGSHTQLTQTFRIVMANGVPQVSLFNTTLECLGPSW